MIPSTMRPWWISLLVDPNQDWFHSYGQRCSLTYPRPLFDDRTSGLSNFLNDVESHHP